MFASGAAANTLTEDSDAKDKVGALFNVSSLPTLSDGARERRRAMLDRLKTLSNENAAKIMTDSGVSPTPPKRCTRDKATESHCTLRDVLSRADNATIDKLEPAFKKIQ
ncbi:MAG: hypothetical protein DMD81_26620 [Candidatus Rokuibacteriota bacterium]|nr:MAG: hypothetical protein DMD81_26620 [Candidatus Rokubacteria bacterium]